MTYEEMRRLIPAKKGSRPEKNTVVTAYQRFSVCKCELSGEIIVDPDVAELIQHRSWCTSHGYATTRIGDELVRLHDYVMALEHEEKPEGCYVDHINQDKLDNRRCNLRFVTPSESSKNLPLRTTNTSGYVGVCRAKNGRFRAYISVNKRHIWLGTYDTLKDAVTARREAETRLGFMTRPGTIKEKLKEQSQLALRKEDKDA